MNLGRGAFLETPVVLVVYNRPDKARRVFDEIAKAKPRKLLIIADGPNHDSPGDSEKCVTTRAAVERVDWDCEVRKNYSSVNLGPGKRIATGNDWVFERVDRAIFLEEDCLPQPTFFRFCEELLEKYQNDERIMMISGRNHLGFREMPYSYCFNRIASIWGWATWRRAWQHFDWDIKLWSKLRETCWVLDILGDPEAAGHWRRLFDKAYRGKNVKYWSYRWSFAYWARNAFAITPNANLIENIGFGNDATHTKSLNDRRANVPATEMVFPLQHPSDVVHDREIDRVTFHQVLLPTQPGIYRRLRRKLSALLPKSL